MNPSRPFILRPVATSLLMAAILLVGIVAFVQLPVSALPEVDYPTIQVLTFYPGASPDVMATTVTAPLERQFGEMQGLSQMTSTSAGRRLGHRAPVQPLARPRRRRRRSPVGDQCGADFPAVRSAYAAGLQQNQPRRRARAHARHHFRLHAAFAGGGPGRYPAGSAHLPVRRRRPGHHQRRPEAGRPHSGQPGPAFFLRPQHGGRAFRPGPGQRQLRQGQLRRPPPGLPDRRQRPDHQRRRLQEHRCLLLQRRAGLRQECRQRGQRGGKHQAGRVDEPDARRHRQHPAPARRQHHHRGQPHPANPAAA